MRDRVTAVAATDAPPPYGAYAAIASTFAGGLGGAGARARRLEGEPEEHTALDLVLLGAATFKVARTIARDEVLSFVRDPFVQGDAHEGGEEPIPTGDVRQAIGELVTCSRCVGTWVAGGLGAVQVLTPRFGRLLTWTLAGAAVNDWLQAGFEIVTKTANTLGEREG